MVTLIFFIVGCFVGYIIGWRHGLKEKRWR